MLDTLIQYAADSGFGQLQWGNLVMIGIGLLFIWLAIKKGFEPLLLVPIGFGILIGNIPYDSAKLSLSVYDGPVSPEDISYYQVDVDQVVIDAHGKRSETTLDAARSMIAPDDQRMNHELLMNIIKRSELVTFNQITSLDSGVAARTRVEDGLAIMVNAHATFSAPSRLPDGSEWDGQPMIVEIGQGRRILLAEQADHDGKYPLVWSMAQQDPTNASILWWLFAGVGLAGFYPPLIFLGIGALTDFGPLMARPKTILLGAAAQFGIFAALLGALVLNFTLEEAASIGIIGGADGPTAIFTCSQLAPDLLGAVALAAYSYMAMVPIIQPPIIRLLTTPAERKIRMDPPANVSKKMRMIFPIVGFLLTAFIAPGGLPLLGMLFFGNLLRESMVTDRLAKTAQSTFIDIVTILLGVTVGAKTNAANFLTAQTIYIFILGIAAFGVATASGVLFAKLMNKLSSEKINPMIGAAGVSAVPMAARVVHQEGLKEDPQNYLIMHAMGPNVAGVIGSAVAAGVLLSRLG